MLFFALATATEASTLNLGDELRVLEESEYPEEFVNNFYQLALAISGLLAFGAIVYGGIKYTAAAGSPSGQTEGKEWITGALWGLLLLAGAVILLNTINPDILRVGLPQELGAPSDDDRRR